MNVSVLEYTGKWSLLALATNAVSTAIAEAGIDVVDLVSATSFALTADGMMIDPSGEEENGALAGGLVGFMASMGEITDTFLSGAFTVEGDSDMDVDNGQVQFSEVIKAAVGAAADARLVINHALMEMVKEKGLVSKENVEQ